MKIEYRYHKIPTQLQKPFWKARNQFYGGHGSAVPMDSDPDPGERDQCGSGSTQHCCLLWVMLCCGRWEQHGDRQPRPRGRWPQAWTKYLMPAVKFFYWSIFKKSRHLGFGVFIDIWSMTPGHRGTLSSSPSRMRNSPRRHSSWATKIG